MVPRGKIMHKGRKVNEFECKKCGIRFVERKNLRAINITPDGIDFLKIQIVRND